MEASRRAHPADVPAARIMAGCTGFNLSLPKGMTRAAQLHPQAFNDLTAHAATAPGRLPTVQRRLAEVLELAEQAGIEMGDAAQDEAQQESQEPPPTAQQEAPAIPPPPTPERIDALLERVQQQEDRKQSERAALPGLDIPEVERDW